MSHDNDNDYRNEVQHLVLWCEDNNLVLNIKKTKQIIVDFGRNGPSNHGVFFIGSEEVESVSSFRFLGVTVAEDLCWGSHIALAVGNAQPHIYYLRELRSTHIPRRRIVDISIPGVVYQLH